MTRSDVPARGRRGALALAVVPVVGAGLLTSRVGGAAADVLGDALYAVLVTLLVSLAVPGRPLRLRAVVAVACCWAVEAAQATGAPAAAVAAWPPAALVLGTTFAWRDLAAYAAGVGVTVLVMRAASRVGGGPGRTAVP